MPKKNKISDADINTFREAVKGVKPMTSRKIRLAPKAAPPVKPRPIVEEEDWVFYFTENERLPPSESGEIILFKQAGVPDKTLRKLSKGQYNVDAKLDLHGMNTEQAKRALNRFMQDCITQHWQVVLLVHGKGLHSRTPILKNRLNHWLRDMPHVLAFCSALAKHGGQGALYVLLKRTLR